MNVLFLDMVWIIFRQQILKIKKTVEGRGMQREEWNWVTLKVLIAYYIYIYISECLEIRKKSYRIGRKIILKVQTNKEMNYSEQPTFKKTVQYENLIFLQIPTPTMLSPHGYKISQQSRNFS